MAACIPSVQRDSLEMLERFFLLLLFQVCCYRIKCTFLARYLSFSSLIMNEAVSPILGRFPPTAAESYELIGP